MDLFFSKTLNFFRPEWWIDCSPEDAVSLSYLHVNKMHGG
jgi:hypothetical protein